MCSNQKMLILRNYVLRISGGSSETDISLSETLCGEHRSLTIRTDGHFIRLVKKFDGFRIDIFRRTSTHLLYD